MTRGYERRRSRHWPRIRRARGRRSSIASAEKAEEVAGSPGAACQPNVLSPSTSLLPRAKKEAGHARRPGRAIAVNASRKPCVRRGGADHAREPAAPSRRGPIRRQRPASPSNAAAERRVRIGGPGGKTRPRGERAACQIGSHSANGAPAFGITPERGRPGLQSRLAPSSAADEEGARERRGADRAGEDEDAETTRRPEERRRSTAEGKTSNRVKYRKCRSRGVRHEPSRPERWRIDHFPAKGKGATVRSGPTSAARAREDRSPVQLHVK